MLSFGWCELVDVVVRDVGTVQEGEDGGVGKGPVFDEEPFELRGVRERKGSLEGELEV